MEYNPLGKEFDGKSFERKANSSSNLESMESTDKLKGNGYDTNNNFNDFVFRNISDPQNSLSELEPREEVIDTVSIPTNFTASFNNDDYGVDIY